MANVFHRKFGFHTKALAFIAFVIIASEVLFSSERNTHDSDKISVEAVESASDERSDYYGHMGLITKSDIVQGNDRHRIQSQQQEDGDRKIEIIDRSNLNRTEIRKAFARRLNSLQLAELQTTLKGCVELLDLYGVEHFLFYDSLLGWFRHGSNMLPWDDKVDIAVIPYDRKLVESVSLLATDLQDIAETDKTFIELHGNFGIIRLEGKAKIRCFSESFKSQSNSEAWKRPYVDFHMADFSSEKHILDKESSIFMPDSKDKQHIFTDIFPLRQVLFEGVEVNIPNKFAEVVRKYYDLRQCQSPAYNHRIEYGIAFSDTAAIKCSELTFLYKMTNLKLIDSFYAK